MFLDGAEEGKLFPKISSNNEVLYNTTKSDNQLLNSLINKNPILTQAQAGISWSCLTDEDAMKFTGIDLVISSEILQLNWKNTITVDSGSVFHAFEISIILKKHAGRRNFRADMEVVYATEWAIKKSMEALIAPADSSVASMVNGRTNVKLMSDENVWIGHCFRTDAAVGFCNCIDGLVTDSEGKCIPADKTTVSCEQSVDVVKNNEKGSMKCDAGYEIRVLSADVTRKDETTCSGGKITDPEQAGYKKWTLTKYKVCATEHSVVDYVKSKCDGQQTCDYKYYDGEFPTEDRAVRQMESCKPRFKYVMVSYGCSKLDPTPKPTEEPFGKLTHFLIACNAFMII